MLHRFQTGLWREVTSLSLSGPTASLALRTALATLLSVVVALFLHLDNPSWAGITALAIIQQDVASSLLRSIDRCLGTIAGAVIGYFSARLVAHHLLFELICAAATTFAIYGGERSKHGYAVLLGAVTVILVMFGSLETPDATISIAVYRCLEILVGVGVSCAVDYSFGPARRGAPPAPKPGIFGKPLDQGLLGIALTGGIATAAIPAIWESLQLPGLGQTPVTAFVIIIAMRKEPAWTAANRLAGCILGGMYGLLCMRLAGDDLIVWLLLMFAGLYASTFVKHGKGDAAYSGHQAAIAILMAMVQGFAPSPDILPAINRLAGIVGGILVVALAQVLLAPVVARVLTFLLGKRA